MIFHLTFRICRTKLHHLSILSQVGFCFVVWRIFGNACKKNIFFSSLLNVGIYSGKYIKFFISVLENTEILQQKQFTKNLISLQAYNLSIFFVTGKFHLRKFHLGKFRRENSIYGKFHLRKIPPMDNSTYGQFHPWTITPMENSTCKGSYHRNKKIRR